MTVVPGAPDMGAATDDTGPPMSWRLSVTVVVIVGAIASFLSVGRASFSLDESVSTTLAGASWHTFSHSVLHREANMSLYYLLLRLWMHLGHSEAVVRSLSVLVSVAALAVLMVLARQLFGRRSAVIGGVLLAVDPLVVMFAQNARGYALSLLLVSCSSALFVSALRSPARTGLWVAYALVSALAAYANFWAALVPLAHGASLAFLARRSAPWRRLVPTAVGLAVLLVPLALLIHATDSSGVNWAAGSSAGKIFSKVRADVPHRVIDLAVLLVVAAVVVTVAVVRRHPKTQFVSAHWPLVFALCWLVVPLSAVVLLSLAYKPLLVVRYLVICLPPFVLLVAHGLNRLRGLLAPVVLAVVVAVSAAGVGAFVLHGSSQDWRAAAALVAERARPGDGVVIFAPYTRIPFQWYIRQHPQSTALLHPAFPPGPWNGDGMRYDASFGVSASAIARDVAGDHRLWLVLSQQELYPAADRALLAGLRSAGFAAGRVRTFAGVQVVDYTAS
ncbi:MAG TPA: glycosyltransferase family 39 protein [Acidimicrobiales bacterium]|nr:glycosyltransferase family 39 protein [Acidimicrobiales bacterium]